MKYVERLIQLKEYRDTVEEIEVLEKDRIFCLHGLSHLLDVARIAYIWNLERNLGMEKESIYLCALLHDIGRGREIQEKVPHEQAGVTMAEDFLLKIEYPIENIEEILRTIGSHRGAGREEYNNLPSLIQAADKKSRNCFACKAAAECYWNEERRNKTIKV